MGIVVIAGMFSVVLAVVALWANRRFGDQPSLPMQWGLDGRVNWSAPRVVAVWFIPVLGMAVLAFAAVLGLTTPPRPGQEGLVAPAQFGLGMAFVAVQALHLVLVARTLR